MAGGLMNLVSVGQQNVILNGNPQTCFFKKIYKKYANFGIQDFRVDYEGTPELSLTETSKFQFKIPRYADLLMDSYLSFNLPNIWSCIMPPQPVYNNLNEIIDYTGWAPYEFKWIDFIGALMISKIEIMVGGQTLQKYSGHYILNAAQRDMPAEKLKLFYEMIGHIPDNIDPANSGAKVNSYPNAFYTDSATGAEPSIRGRQLMIPLNAFFCLDSHMAFPLVSLQYNFLEIYVTLRPINEMIRIRDVMDTVNNYPYVAPNFNQYYMQMYRFLQTPPDVLLDINSYVDKRSVWYPDIHLECRYGFLSNEEQNMFAISEHKYLITEVYENIFYNVTGANIVNLNSFGLVKNWMFYFQRSDVNLRNEWTNYTNWPYGYLPSDIIPAPTSSQLALIDGSTIGPAINPDGTQTGFFISGDYYPENVKKILLELAIIIDGAYRENKLSSAIYNFVQKYANTGGGLPENVYCYNFCLDTDIKKYQPSGAINMNRFQNIQFEFTTYIPKLNPYAQNLSICDGKGAIIAINKSSWHIYEYNYNLIVYEERINQVEFIGGNCGLTYAKAS